MELVFNEWFVEFMVQEQQKRGLVWRLLDVLEVKGDRLVIKRKSPFVQKFNRLNKLHGNPGQPSRPWFKRFSLLMRAPSSIRLVDEHEIPELPKWVSEVVKDGDLYLVQTAALTNERTIVTTDAPLRDSLNGKDDFRVVLLEDFVAEYLR